MNSLSIDIETYSSCDLPKCGAYKYAESPDFETLLIAYSADMGKIIQIDLVNGEKIPQEFIDALIDPKVTKWAYNAAFERICLSRLLRDMGIKLDGEFLNPESWKCSMTWAAYLSLPQSLEDVGAVLNLDKQKMTEGKELIRYFCTPCKSTKANGQRTRNLPRHAPEKWDLFKKYNMKDVDAELAIQKRLFRHPVPPKIWTEYVLDQEINDRGVLIDGNLVERALELNDRSTKEITELLKKLTGVDNPNSVMQLKRWLEENGLKVDSLDKKAIGELLKIVPEHLRRVLELRQQLAKSSIKKYQAMANAVCADNRARGMFKFLGASRTGRWSGRIVQLQNLKRNTLPDLSEARELVLSGDYEAVDMLYGSVPDTLSELVRTAFVPQDGEKFIVADFAAIEARVIAWLACEQWRLDVFSTHGRIYEASASQMFSIPIEKIRKGNPEYALRQKGKIAELALGYGGSIGALTAMGALEMGLKEDELQPLVDAWRFANPNIVKLWRAVDRAAKDAVLKKIDTETHGIKFVCRSGMLFIILPSGRSLSYVRPRIGTNRFGSDSITYENVGENKKWQRVESYGAKFVENIVQSLSRDLLAYAMQTLRNYRIVMHIHDEIVIEANENVSVDEICKLMGKTPAWAKGLTLKAEGYECKFYKKD